MMKTLGSFIQLVKKLPKDDFLIQEEYIFKGTRLCIPKCGTRELLIREIHGGSLASYHGENKTLTMLREHNYLPGMAKNVPS